MQLLLVFNLDLHNFSCILFYSVLLSTLKRCYNINNIIITINIMLICPNMSTIQDLSTLDITASIVQIVFIMIMIGREMYLLFSI